MNTGRCVIPSCDRRRLLLHVPGALAFIANWQPMRPPVAKEDRAPVPVRGMQSSSAPYTASFLADVTAGVADTALDINSDGAMVGVSATEADGVSVAVLWPDPVRATILPTLGGPMAEAHAINDEGRIAGAAMDASGNIRPSLWTDGEPLDLGTLGGPNGVALALNTRGQVVGWTEDSDGHRMPFLWEDGRMVNLGQWPGSIDIPALPDDDRDMIMSMGGVREAWDINDAGQVVGDAGFPVFFMHGVLWQDGQMIDLGTLGGDFANARSINTAGQVTGWSQLTVPDPMDTTGGDPGHAWLWTDGELTDLGAPADAGWSRGVDINNAGVIALRGGRDSYETSAYLWRKGEFILLDTYSAAHAVNEAGVACGVLDTGEGALAMRWTPAR